MKLYYSPGACSLSPHIVLREAELDFTPVRVDIKTHTLQDGTDYYSINPKGYVPLLELDTGERLTEGPAVVQCIADKVPAKLLVAACGTIARYHVQEWLNFVTSELHKTFSPLFSPATPEDYKTTTRAKISDRLKWVDSQLANQLYLLSDHFSVADAYLYTITRWTKPTHIDISMLPNLTAYMARVEARPAVQEALKFEGLLK